MITETELAELLAAKFCHDIAGPVGAISNGIEFLQEEESTMYDQAMELVEASSKEAIARLQFFRQAYGKVNDTNDANISQLRQLIELLLSTTKNTLEWQDTTNAAEGNINQRMGKLLLNLVVIASAALLQGGKIVVTLSQDAKNHYITVALSGKAIKVDFDTLHLLMGKLEGIEITTKNVQVYFTYLISRQVNAHLEIQQETDRVQLGVAIPK